MAIADDDATKFAESIKKINVKFVRSEVIRDDVYTNKYQESMT